MKHERVGKHAWRFRMNWPDPSPETAYFPHCAAQLLKDAKSIMEESSQLWTIHDIAMSPATSPVRPRVGILYCTINEGMREEFDANRSVWKAIEEWRKVHHHFLDRVAIVIMGTAASWTICKS